MQIAARSNPKQKHTGYARDAFDWFVEPAFCTELLADQLSFDRVSDPQWTIWFGVRHHFTERFAMEVGFGEDLSTDGPPDFTAWLAFVFDLGGGGV